MTPTTLHTTWVRTFQGSSPDPRHDVLDSLGDYANNYDIDRLTRAWVDAINAHMPHWLTLTLHGEVHGPAHWPGDAAQALRDAVETVDFSRLLAPCRAIRPHRERLGVRYAR